MSVTAWRGVIGVMGLLALLGGLGFWLDPLGLGLAFGLAPQTPLGHASLRGDFGAFFGVIGGFLTAAAILNDERLVLTPLLLFAVTLAGRIVTVVTVGLHGEMVAPMVAEVLGIAAMIAYRRAANTL